MNAEPASGLRIALASKGDFEEATRRFLDSAGLSIWRPNPRQYVGRIGLIPGAEVLFQRPEDIVHKVADGSAEVGITGFDLVSEHTADDPDTFVVIEDLGFRRCQLVLAVPEAWLDIATIDDLAELSIAFKRDGRQLRVATKFRQLVSSYLYRNGVNYFTITDAHGALEAAPALGYADVIADLTETGVTLRDNQLRVVEGGIVLRSQACLIANIRRLRDAPERLEQARAFIERVEAKREAHRYQVVDANVPAADAAELARRIAGNLDLAGDTGPTISPVYAKDGSADQWHAVSLVVEASRMMSAVDHLRQFGARGITVSTPDYVFGERSDAFTRLLEAIEHGGNGNNARW